MRFLIVFILQLITSASFAQIRTVGGTVVDMAGEPLSNVFVTLLTSSDSLAAKTNEAGHFIFTSKISAKFQVKIAMVEYEPFSKHLFFDTSRGDAIHIAPIRLKVSVKDLKEIILTVSNPVTVREDTIEYRADAYKLRQGAVVEDVLKKLPGLHVDRDGNLTAQGKEVQMVRVNGKDYFGGDVKTATQNLPATIIENIQIIDDYGDKAKYTGIKSGEPEKILNINIKKDKDRGVFGNATVAAGTHDRYAASISANNFNDQNQISFFATVNNINSNGYEFSGGRGNVNRNTNGTAGVNDLSKLSFNHRTVWKKKLTSYASINSISTRNSNKSASFLQDFNPVNINTIRSTNENQSEFDDHRFSWQLEYKIDSANLIKIFPYIASSKSENSQRTAAEYNRPKYTTLNDGTSKSQDRSPSWGTDLFFLRKFRKGRTVSLSAYVNRSNRDQLRDIANDYTNVDSTTTLPFSNYVKQNQIVVNDYINTRTSVNLSYVETIGKGSFLEASLIRTWSGMESLRDVNDVDQLTGEKTMNFSQSNEYKYQFTTTQMAVSLSSRKKKLNYYVGMSAQPSILTGTDTRKNVQINRAAFNLIPSVRIGYRFTQNKVLTATYNGSMREPGFLQLQPVTDSSNVKNIITGNPNLRPEFTNRFSLQFNRSAQASGRSLFANLYINNIQNKIVSSRVNDQNGTGRTTTFVNTNGFRGVNGNISLSRPFAKKKLIISFTGYGSYDNNISFTDNQRNSGNNWSIRPGMNARVDLPDLLDLTVSASYVYNKNTTRYPTYNYSSQVKTLQFSVDGRYYFFKSWSLGYDFTKNIFIGYLKSFNTSPSMLNVYVERKLLKNKKGLIRLQGFDLFNENIGISRSVNGTTITDVEVNRLSRYFMVSFNYRLQKFGR